MHNTTTTPSRAPSARTAEPVPTLTLVDHPDRAFIGASRRLPRGLTLEFGRGVASAFPGAFDDEAVSRRHAVLEITEGGPRLTDCKSRNGSFVNGTAVTRHTLELGDVLGIGPALLLFHLAPPLGGPMPSSLLGISAPITGVLRQVALVAPRDITVMILGETGVGKELVARELHERSGRSGPFVALNCAGVSDQLLHSDLFGHVKGAFTGASTGRAGLIEAAREGTLFLDEITDASASFQASLLRLLETAEFRPVGSDRTLSADARFIAAAQPRIAERIETHKFRQDLWTRLAQWRIHVPSLADHPEDIPLLTRVFAEQEHGGPVTLPQELMLRLMRAPWRGNVRELRAFVERLVIANEGAQTLVLPRWLEEELPTQVDPQPLKSPPSARPQGATSRAKPSRDALAAACEDAQGSVRAMSKRFGVSRKTIYRWLEAYALDPEPFRRGDSGAGSEPG